MFLEAETIEDVLGDFYRRVEAVKAVGGVPMLAVVEGVAIPKGWRLDYGTAYFVPPDFLFSPALH